MKLRVIITYPGDIAVKYLKWYYRIKNPYLRKFLYLFKIFAYLIAFLADIIEFLLDKNK